MNAASHFLAFTIIDGMINQSLGAYPSPFSSHYTLAAVCCGLG